MFLETTPEGKIYKELAADHFADPKGLGKYALFLRPSQGDLIPAPQMEPSLLLSGRYRPITLEGRNLFATRDFYAFFKHLEETGRSCWRPPRYWTMPAPPPTAGISI